MTPRVPAFGGASGGRPSAARWRLAPLLVLRALIEERERADLSRALGAAVSAQEDAAARRRLLSVRGVGGARTVMSGAELAGAAHYLNRLRRDAADAADWAKATEAAAVEARGRYARARDAREALERKRERWLEVRLRAREAALERDLEDFLACGRR